MSFMVYGKAAMDRVNKGPSFQNLNIFLFETRWPSPKLPRWTSRHKCFIVNQCFLLSLKQLTSISGGHQVVHHWAEGLRGFHKLGSKILFITVTTSFLRQSLTIYSWKLLAETFDHPSNRSRSVEFLQKSVQKPTDLRMFRVASEYLEYLLNIPSISHIWQPNTGSV